MAYYLVESNFIFQMPPSLRGNFLGENFFGYNGVFPVQIKLLFPKGPFPSRENFLGENFFGHDGVFTG